MIVAVADVITAPWATTTSGPRRSYPDVFRRHRVLGTLPIILALLISGYFIARPKPYTTVATMWVDAPVPAASTVLVPDPSGWVSSNASNVLTEALTSDSFLSTVAAEMHIRPAPGPVALQALGKKVVAGAPGPQLVTITVTDASSSEAISLANAVGDQFSRFVATALAARQQSAVVYDRTALDSAASAVSAASNALASYNQSHAGAATNPADPTEVQLARNLSAAQGQYSASKQAYDEALQAANQSVTTAIKDSNVSGVPRVLDRATSATRGSRKKVLIYGGLGGLLGGLTVSGLVLALLMSADKSIRNEDDLEGFAGLQVAGAVEEVGGRRSPGVRRRRGVGAGGVSA